MNKRLSGLWVAAAVLGVCWTQPALARDPFALDINIGGLNRTFGFDSIQAAIDQVDPDRLRDSFTGKNPDTERIIVGLNFRGLEGVTLGFAVNNAVLSFAIPLAGIDQQFDGGGCDSQTPGDCTRARKIAIEKLKRFLKEDRDALKRLLTALARYSPIDPLAGNPLSLMTQKMKGDFRDGFTHKVSQIWGCGTTAFNFSDDAPIQLAAVGGVDNIFAAQLRAGNEIGAGVFLTSTEADGFASTGLTIPFSYTANLDSLPGHKVRVDLPLSYTDTEGAVTYSLGFGLAYTYPISDVWSLTPGLGVGATGSEDLGAAGGVGAYSLTSAYTWRLGDYALSMGNSLGKYDSLGLKIGDIEAEADISNTVFTNGLLLSGPNSLIAKNLVLEYSIQDTRITGDEVYSEYYDEVGIALGYIDTERGVIDSYVKGGLSYLVGANDITAIKLNLSVRF